MRQIMPKRLLTVITAILAALTFAQPGWTQSTGPGRDMDRERAIWQGLEKIAPKSVETFKAATEAFDKMRALELAQKALAAYQTQNRRDDPYYAMTVAQIAFDLGSIKDARAAVNALAASHPDQFLDSGVHTRAQGWRYLYYSFYLVGAWIVGLAALFTLGKLFSNLTLRSIEEADPNGGSGAKETSLRSRYKRLINVAGVYYYISLPVVIFLVIAVAGSIIYGFLMIGRIPVKLALIVVVAAAVTIYKMIRSLFVKIESEDPGRALKPEEAPGLWALTREVAQAVSTRPIDEIRVTPGCDLAVYEKGGFREKLQDRAKRILILGVGALNGLRQNAFRAVLAHEYGHFSHRDTAGGDVALRVEQDMTKFAYAMALAGQAVWWNIAFQFLRVYHFIFRRITHGATRLQEILADRVAVRNYGAESFEEGLRHVIRREVEFNRVASKEIEEASQARRDLKNLYQLQVSPEVFDQQMIETEINDIITRPTTEDDTHPSPVDRFRLAQRIVCNNLPASNAMVWVLFASRESLTAEMSKLIDDRVKEAATA